MSRSRSAVRERVVRAAPWLLFAVLLAWSSVLKVDVCVHETTFAIDGGFYAHVAEHVRDGHGLVSDVSLYHHGYREYPNPTAVYPLWPWLLGVMARLVPLDALAVWLPTVLWFAACVFAYLWGRATWGPLRWGLDAGHLVLLCLLLNVKLWRATCRPYTEGLAYALMFVGLWRGGRHLRGPTIRGGVELGLLAALVTLTRPQLVLWPLALACAVAFGVARVDVRGYGRLMVGALAAFVVTMAPFFWWQYGVVTEPGFFALLRFDAARATDTLSRIPMLVRTDGLWELIRDRAAGVWVAFDPDHRYGYFKAHTWLAFAMPLALGVAGVDLAWLLLRGRWSLRAPWAARAQPQQVARMQGYALAIGAVLSVHLIHKAYNHDWHFSERSGVVAGLGMALALGYLLRRSRVSAAAAVLVLAVTVPELHQRYVQRVEKTRRKHAAVGPTRFQRIAAWLEHERARLGEERLVVAITKGPQLIVPYTTNVAYQWVQTRSTLTDVELMFDELGAVRLLAPSHGARNYRFWRDRRAFDAAFEPTGQAVAGLRVYKRREGVADYAGD